MDAAGPAADPALDWVAASLTAQSLAEELQESTRRMSDLVGAVKSYAYMDRGDLQEIDIHEGLETTLTILGHKLKHTRIDVVRHYDRELPRMTVRGSQLNQVWTNLLDNAIDALGEDGTITITTLRDGGCIEVTSPTTARASRRSSATASSSLLHHEGGRQGHRPGARDRVPDRRRPSRRVPDRRLRAGPDALQRPPPHQADVGGPMAECTHLDHVLVIAAARSVDGCEDCLRDGGVWLHLRICLECGHVGCCDDSPSKHATQHAGETQHPIIRSLEPGENWSWCYPDELLMRIDRVAGQTRIPPSPMLGG